MKIAIASGKGGTGKTTLSTNLAHYISNFKKTLLVDLDVEEPNSGLFIKLKHNKTYIKTTAIPRWEPERCTFCGDCQKNCNFNAVIMMGTEIMVFPQLCHSCYACSELCPEGSLPMEQRPIGVLKTFFEGNLHFVESRLDIGQEMAVPLISQTIDFAEKNYDNDYLKIYDSPPGTSCPVIETIKDVDYVILVTEPTPFGLNDLKLAVETARQLNKDFGVVINKYGLGNHDIEKYCKEQQIDIIGKIKNNRKIAEIYSTGQLLYDKIPEFKEQLDIICRKLKI